MVVLTEVTITRVGIEQSLSCSEVTSLPLTLATGSPSQLTPQQAAFQGKLSSLSSLEALPVREKKSTDGYHTLSGVPTKGDELHVISHTTAFEDGLAGLDTWEGSSADNTHH